MKELFKIARKVIYPRGMDPKPLMGRQNMIISKVAKNTFFLFCGFLLVGCQAKHPIKPIATEPDIVSTRLAQAAEKAASALDTISEIEQVRAPSLPATPDYSNAPAALQQLMTVEWSGPVEQVLQTLAARVGMQFRTQGNKPAVPLLVSLNVYQKPIIEVLSDLGLQVGRRAEITVQGQKGYIEIRYSPVDRT